MFNRKMLVLLMALMLAVVSAASAQDLQETFTLALSGELQTMDPYASSNEEGFLITQMIYENLLKKDADGKAVMTDDKYDIEDTEGLAHDVAELLDVETDISISKITMEDLDKIDSDDRYDALSPGEVTALLFMIRDEE